MTLENITLSLIRSFREPIIKLLGGVSDEILQVLDESLPKYVNNYYLKFSKSKTFLFRDFEVPFEKTYFPITLNDGQFGSSEFKILNLETLYRNNNHTTIIGKAGSGKSMLMKNLFLLTLNQKVKIPIFIELRSLNHHESTLEEYISENILNQKLAKSDRILERLLRSGYFYFLFDGYDEIYSSIKDKLTHDIESFIDKYNSNWFVITSRPGSGIQSLPRFTNNYVQPLSKLEIIDFIDKQCQIIGDTELGNNIKESIEKVENKSYYEYLSSPLLLSMFLLTYRTYPDLPTKRSKFYWNVYNTLSTSHDSFTKRGGWQHERKSGLENDAIENVLEWLSFISFINGDYEFDQENLTKYLKEIKTSFNLNFGINSLIEDLVVNLNILQKDGLLYVFPHKSMQEYFTSKLISSQEPESKWAIYTEDIFNLSNNLRDGSLFSFYGLCQEVDEITFKKYLIFLLKKVILRFKTNSPKELITSYFEFSGYKYYVEKDDDESPFYSETLHEHHSNCLTDILRYTGINKGYFDLFHYITKTIEKEEYQNLFRENPLNEKDRKKFGPYDYILEPLGKDKIIIDQLILLKMQKDVQLILNKINSKIETYQNDINLKESGFHKLRKYKTDANKRSYVKALE